MAFADPARARAYKRQWALTHPRVRPRVRDAIAERARKVEWKKANREKVRASMRAYYDANRDRILARGAAHRAKNADRELARHRAYAEANSEKEKVRKLAWKLANPDKVKAGSRAYHVKNRDKSSEANRVRYVATKAVMAAQSAAWKKANANKVREYSMRRNAIKKATAVEPIDYDLVLRGSLWLCGICQKSLDLFGYHFDHIIPLSKGGTHTQGNIQVAHAHCNIVKGARVAA